MRRHRRLLERPDGASGLVERRGERVSKDTDQANKGEAIITAARSYNKAQRGFISPQATEAEIAKPQRR